MTGNKKDNSATITRLGTVARLSRTALAVRLLAHGFYAGQDQIMLALGDTEGMTPGQLAQQNRRSPPNGDKNDQSFAGTGICRA